MKQILIIIILVFASCKTKPQDIKTENMDELDKKIEEIVTYATEGLPDYSKMNKLPDLYNIIISSSNCKYEVLINDFPSASFLDDSQGSVMSESKGINFSLLSSGTTPIEIRLLPPTGKKNLNKYASISVKIEHIPHMGRPEGKKNIWSYEMPMLEKNLPIFIHKDVFKVTVPFEINDLDDAINLTTMDSTQLRKEVETQFASFKDILEQGNEIAYLEFTRERKKIGAIQYYSTKQELREEMTTDVQRIQKSKLLPLPDAMLKLYCNNRVVTFENAETLETYFWMDDGEYLFGRTIYLYKNKKDGKWHVW